MGSKEIQTTTPSGLKSLSYVYFVHVSVYTTIQTLPHILDLLRKQ
jgi:hypothetical protein